MTLFWLLALTFQPAQAGVPLVIKVESGVELVTIACSDGHVQTEEVKNGSVSLDLLPKNCVISATRRIGMVNSPGEWTCNVRGCSLDVPPHKEVADADGRINLIFLDAGAASTIELSCTGYRERTPIEDFTATFNGVPKEECTVYAKGGTTAKSQPLSWGTHVCTISGPTLICQPYRR